MMRRNSRKRSARRASSPAKGQERQGGQAEPCGWRKDKYGLSWQIVPSALGEMTASPDRQKAGRALTAMLQMLKLDRAALRKAAEGR